MTDILHDFRLQALAWTLVHFVWQGALIGLGAALLLRGARASLDARYWIAVAAMAGMLAAPVATFAVLAGGANGSGAGASRIVDSRLASVPSLAVRTSPGTAAGRAVADLGMAGGAAALIWAASVILLTGRLARRWIAARRLATRAVAPAAAHIRALATRVAGRLALDRAVHVLESSAATVPMTIGWLKPVVILPAAALAGLTPLQVEALIAHELAHVRRHDYLVNVLQSAVETLLFYHPAVWWLSREVRSAREHCCDDVAVGICDRLTYVTALADLAAMIAAPSLALAATDGSLLARVRRILGGTDVETRSGFGWIGAFGAIAVLGIVVPVALVSARQAQDPGRAPAPDVRAVGRVVHGATDAVIGGMVQGGPGIVGGVVGGVIGGVRDGVVDGVIGGVMRGVHDGIVDGVSGGMAGALAGSAQQDDEIRQAKERDVETLQQALLELEAKLKAAQAALTAGAGGVRDLDQVANQAKIEAMRKQIEAVTASMGDNELIVTKVRKALQEAERRLEDARIADDPTIAAALAAQSKALKEQLDKGLEARAEAEVAKQKLVEQMDSGAAKALTDQARLEDQIAEMKRKMEDAQGKLADDELPRKFAEALMKSADQIKAETGRLKLMTTDTGALFPADDDDMRAVLAMGMEQMKGGQSGSAGESVFVGGAVRVPGALKWHAGMTVADAVKQAGGFMSDADQGTVRKVYEQPADASPVKGEKSEKKMPTLWRASGSLALDTVLQAGDIVLVAKKK